MTGSLSDLKIEWMGFLNNLKSAVYDPKFYSKIKHQSLGSALKYFFLLALLLAFINILLLSYDLFVRVPQEIRSFITQAVGSYPSELQVEIHNGQVSTNAEEPFFVPMPETDKEYDGVNNLLVIDTKTPFSAAQFDQYKTVAWLTRDSLFFQNREYEQKSIALNEVKDFKVNKEFVNDLAEKVHPWLNFVGPVLMLIIFVGMFLGFGFNLIYMLFLAVLVFFLSGIFKWGLNYKASFITAIYASTIAFIVDLVLFNTGFYTGFFGFPFLFTLIALCVATVNLQNFEEKS